MSGSLNRAMLLGYLAADPQVLKLGNGSRVVQLIVETTGVYLSSGRALLEFDEELGVCVASIVVRADERRLHNLGAHLPLQRVGVWSVAVGVGAEGRDGQRAPFQGGRRPLAAVSIPVGMPKKIGRTSRISDR